MAKHVFVLVHAEALIARIQASANWKTFKRWIQEMNKTFFLKNVLFILHAWHRFQWNRKNNNDKETGVF